MNLRLQHPRFVYSAVAAFLIVAVAAVALQQWWWLALPVVVLFYIWTFEKPALFFYGLIATIPWSVEYQFSETLGTDFPDEPLMWLNALTALLLIFRYKSLRQKLASHPVLWLLVLQLLWAGLTIYTSTFPLLSLKYVLAKSWYLLAFVVLPLLLLDTKQKLKTAAVVLGASMLVLVLLTLVRHAALGFTFAAINESLSPFFRNHVNYSALLIFMLPLLVRFLKSATARSVKIIVSVLLLMSLAALYFSYARGAWMAAVVGVVAYGLLKKKALLAAYLFAGLLTLLSVFWLQQNDRYLQYAHNFNKTIFHTDFSEHLVATYQLKDMSTAERFYRWVAGVRMIKDGWKTGFGPNTFYNNYRSYTVPAFKTWVSTNDEHSTVHNYFLLLLIEQGVIGLLLFLMLLAVAFHKAQRLYHTESDPFWKRTVALIAVILAMICTVNFLSDLIETDKVGSVFYLCLAVLMIADKKTSGSDFTTHVQRIA